MSGAAGFTAKKERGSELALANRRIAEAMAARDAAIREAFESGMPVAEIAVDIGMTRQGVYRILKTKP